MERDVDVQIAQGVSSKSPPAKYCLPEENGMFCYIKLFFRLFRTREVILICQVTELSDQFDFFGIIGMMVRSVEVVEPFGEIHVVKFAGVLCLPSAFPWLVGLIFARDEAPVIATDFFHVEEREKTENIVVKNPAEPFGVDDRASFFFQAFDDSYVHIVVAVEVIRNQIRIFKNDVLDLFVRIIFAGIQKLITHPESGGQRLGGIAGADGIEHPLEDGWCDRGAVSRSGLVVYVPNADSGIVLIRCNDLAHHVEVSVAVFGVVKIKVGRYA